MTVSQVSSSTISDVIEGMNPISPQASIFIPDTASADRSGNFVRIESKSNLAISTLMKSRLQSWNSVTSTIILFSMVSSAYVVKAFKEHVTSDELMSKLVSDVS